MQIVSTLRNTLADAIDADIDSSNTGYVRFYNTALTIKVATMALETGTCFNAATGGVITLQGTPKQDSGPAAGTVGRVGFYQNSTTAAGNWRVLCGVATSGSPDITMANNVVATTDTVELTSFSITVPAGTPDDS
jgi:hypothetical protein